MCEFSANADFARAVLEKKQELDAIKLRIPASAFSDLDRTQRIDITYTSNALEGNTLTAGETALVLEKGITIGGKPLKDHLEAVDHARALDWVIEIAQQSDRPIMEADIRNLHRLVTEQSDPLIAGRYADRARFVVTSKGPFYFPAPLEVPVLMEAFCKWLAAEQSSPEAAFKAHRNLVNIHPFNDGNGRTARLLMNLVLARAGYPPIAIRPDNRTTYLTVLEHQDFASFDQLMYRHLDQTLTLFLIAADQALAIVEATQKDI